MKKGAWIFLLGVLFCVPSLDLWAGALSGEILDIFGDNTATIQLSENPGLNSGDRIDLTYMAGVLPMAIGVYELATVQGAVVIARPVSLVMPPSKGMTVQVDIVKSAGGAAPALAARAPVKPVTTQDRANVPRAADAPAGPGLTGEVTEVMGEDIRVAISGPGTPQVGWPVELFYVTAQGKELPVGTWRVTAFEGQTLSAAKEQGLGSPRKGLKAVIHNGPWQKVKMVENNVSPGPGGAGAVADLFSGAGPGIFQETPANQPPPINLLGETPPPVQADLHPPFNPDFFAAPASTAGAPQITDDPGPRFTGTFDQYKAALEGQQGDTRTMIAKQITAFSVPRRYWLGVEVETNRSTLGQIFDAVPVGVRVVRVFPRSPAAKARLEIADIIYEANGVAVTGADQFTNMVNDAPDGKLRLKIQRNYKDIEVKIRLKKIK